MFKLCARMTAESNNDYAKLWHELISNCVDCTTSQFRQQLETLESYDFPFYIELIETLVNITRIDLLQIVIDNHYYDLNSTIVIRSLITYSTIESMQWLINNGFDIVLNQEQILFACIDRGSVQIMKFFIDNGLNPLNYENNGLLARACNRYDRTTSMTIFLLDYGLNVNACCGKALLESSIHHTVNINLIRILLEHGADLNLNNGKELSWAIKMDYEPLILLYLQYGADIHLLNDYVLRTIPLKKSDQLLLGEGLDPTVLLRINCDR